MKLNTLSTPAKEMEKNIISYVFAPTQMERINQLKESIETYEIQCSEKLKVKISSFTDKFGAENEGQCVKSALDDCNKVIKKIDTIFDKKI